jgi:demethylmenaquinone methyltransferase/2-methoxy-6-polyprenyl-1,4-benzoquinol methylase
MKRTYFEELAPRWDLLPGPPDAEARVERFLGGVLPPNCRRILDVGCGTGILVEPILRTAPSIALLVELDYAHAMLVENRRKRQAEVQVAYVCSDTLSPPLADGAFDAALCFNVLPHVNPLEPALRALLSTLRPGGWLAVGHMMSSGLLNEMHASIGGPVGEDRLLAADKLAGLIRGLGTRIVRAEEREDGYLVLAEKPE